jgi:hypothetical protein
MGKNYPNAAAAAAVVVVVVAEALPLVHNLSLCGIQLS